MFPPAGTSPMKSAKKKPTAANLRSWRVILIRSKGEYLGSVEACLMATASALSHFAWTLNGG
jgi:hypothetical protein